jgi:6-phosphofructokinase 2
MRKLRCTSMRRDAGGGGINVARVVRRLGSEVAAIYPAGGSTGLLLRRLVEQENVRSIAITVAEETRENFTVLEENSGQQYRFVLPGPHLVEVEWRACLSALDAIEEFPAYVVGSGSLPPGVPDDFYAQMARIAKRRGSNMVLDTSGRPLSVALEEGVYLVKPNLRELRELVNAPLLNESEWLAGSRRLIQTGAAEVIALTLGENGALLVTREVALRAYPPDIKPLSAVGAGDSFTGGIVWSLAASRSIADAFRHGVAAGSAAVMNPGTELCHAQDVARLYEQIQLVPIGSKPADPEKVGLL